MESTQTLSKVALKCELCDEPLAEIANPENLTKADALLLNFYLDPMTLYTEKEKARLVELLGGQPTCPVHGNLALGYVTEFKITTSEYFLIDPEPERPSPLKRLLRFLEELLFRR